VKRTQKSESVRVYADTSVFGGVFDDEFEIPTKEFFNEVKSGRFGLVTSAVVKTEIETAPVHVREFFNQMLPAAEIAEVTEEALRLQRAYLTARILSPNWTVDALHVALASVHRCALIVS